MQRKTKIIYFVILSIFLGFSINATAAVLSYNALITPDVIFGSGNINGGFTRIQQGQPHIPNVIVTNNGMELGLRAKLRFDENGLPQNIFNNNNNGTFSFDTGAAPAGAAQWVTGTTPIWNFEWSINTNYTTTNTTTRFLDDYYFELGIDFDPSQGTNFLIFDPINVDFADHAIGINSTPNGGGTVATSPGGYAILISSNNVAQNSWNMEFFNDNSQYIFNPNIDGTYDFYLKALWKLDNGNMGTQIARTSIQIIVGDGGPPVPIPGAFWLLGSGLIGFFGIRRKLKK